MDAWTLAVCAALLVAIGAGGYAWGRWKAVMWLAVLPWAILSLGADTAWWTGLWDRSEEYEPLPFSMFVIPIWIPCCCVAVALGLGVRHATDRRRGRA